MAEPAASFRYRRLHLLPPSTNGNRYSQLAPWLTPSQLREDFPDKKGDDQGGKTPAADHRRELHSRVQYRSSDTCPQACHVINQNVQGLMSRDKLEKTIKVMIKKGIHGYCLKET